MTIEFSPLLEAEAAGLAAAMRDDDRREYEATGLPADQVIKINVRNSILSQVIRVDGEFAGAWGICTPFGIISETGNPWLLTTPLVERHKKTFLRESRAHTDMAQRLYRRLEVYCDARYARSLNWLDRWLGFTPVQLLGVGPNSVPFYLMARER